MAATLMLEEYLDILLAVREGCEGIEDVVLRTGQGQPEARRHVQMLSDAGFLRLRERRIHMTASGQALLATGFDEAIKRALRERLGAEIDAAS